MSEPPTSRAGNGAENGPIAQYTHLRVIPGYFTLNGPEILVIFRKRGLGLLGVGLRFRSPAVSQILFPPCPSPSLLGAALAVSAAARAIQPRLGTWDWD